MVDIERLKTAKAQQKITYDELSAKSGVPVSTIYDLFRGVTTAPRVDTLQAIERALGLDQPKPAWTEEDKALGVGDHPVHLSEEEWTWLELRSVLLDVMGKDYLNALIKMLEEIIRKKS